MVILSAAMVAIISGLAIGGYYFSVQQPRSAEVTIQTKAAEISLVISKNETGTIFGFSTGGSLMTDVELEPYNVTLGLPGGAQSVLLEKHALCIIGSVVADAPAENFSVSSDWQHSDSSGVGSCIRILNGVHVGEQAAFIVPVPTIAYACSASDLNVTVHSVRILLGAIDGEFSASGTFDLLLLKSGWKGVEYCRYASVPSVVEILVDGVRALSFPVCAGDKVSVEIGCICFEPVRLR